MAPDPIRPLFLHCPRCAAAGFSTGEGPDLSCGACGFVYYLNPAVAVAAFVRDAQGRLLLLRRALEPARGKLAPPGGFIDKLETAEAALRREVFEEVGLDVLSLQYLTSQPNLYEYKGVTYTVLDLFFLATVQSFKIKADPSEVAGYELRDLASIDPDELAFPSMRAAFAVLKSLPGH